MPISNTSTMSPETRLRLINLFDSMAESVRRGTFSMTEEQAMDILRAAVGISKTKPTIERPCTITEACDYLGISQPTFRKYIREGLIPQGRKIPGYIVWDKSDIEDFKKSRK